MDVPAAAAPEMTRRSYYLPKEAADALAEALDDLHYATRRPKHAVLAEMLAVALEHRADVEARLARRGNGDAA
jgi:predicted transcriptional regulator